MALFVIRHQHEAEQCMAQDPHLGAQLLNHLSRPSARRRGIEIRGEAVVKGEHTLYMIVESESENHLREFVKPFATAGSVDIFPALTCAAVVAGGGCAESLLMVDDAILRMDPVEACQRAIDAGLLVHRAHPLNCETSIPALVGGVVMPNAHFYVRNHFHIPIFAEDRWRLEVGGLVERPLSLSLRDLKNLPSHTMVATLECAGNGRSLIDPPIEGEKWELGAVSTAEWTGVPLVEVLGRAGNKAEACAVLFRGADSGKVPARAEEIYFERSLTLDQAMNSEVLLAYAMNGEPLPIQHGHPLRIIVPGWYAVASVKWLTNIELIGKPFTGHYQVETYFYEWQRDGKTTQAPVTLQRVRSLITEPRADQQIERGDVAIRGVAWSGSAPIARVEVSVGDGSWQQARLVGEGNRHSWQWWELITRVQEPGTTRIRARASDLEGRVQPQQPEWNRFGYGNNVTQAVSVVIK